MLGNPFSSTRIQPGALTYLENEPSQGNSLHSIVENWQVRPRTTQIVGPHGCGKTAFTVELAKRLWQREGVRSTWLTLRKKGPFSFPVCKSDDYQSETQNPKFGSHGSSTIPLYFIDGIECLSTLQRLVTLQAFGKRRQIVITTHQVLPGYPVLFRVSPQWETFQKLCDSLVDSNWHPDWQSKVRQAFDQCHGNYREAFFRLYDHYDELSQG